MSLEKVSEYLDRYNARERIRTFTVSSATVELAARALSVEPARIAKTLSFLTKEGGCFLVVAAGDARIDNPKFRSRFGLKAKMPHPDEVEAFTGHPAGGVCPFAPKEGVEVYLDQSLRRFEIVYPAAGTASSAVKLTPDELFTFSQATAWVDVCKLPESEQ